MSCMGLLEASIAMSLAAPSALSRDGFSLKTIYKGAVSPVGSPDVGSARAGCSPDVGAMANCCGPCRPVAGLMQCIADARRRLKSMDLRPNPSV